MPRRSFRRIVEESDSSDDEELESSEDEILEEMNEVEEEVFGEVFDDEVWAGIEMF